MKKHLLIISHTGHYLDNNGSLYGWTSTIKEIDFLASHFEKITHLAVLFKNDTPPLSTSRYESDNVNFIGIPPFGGAGFLNKIKILFVIPFLFFKTAKVLASADFFQFRAPTSIGVFLIPFLTLFYWKKGWYKYAGNWMQPNKPFSYRIQKWMLENMQRKPVTINGNWPNQKKHCLTFENPCLHDKYLEKYRAQSINKNFGLPLIACFVGRLEDAKGVGKIIEVLNSEGVENKIKTFHFIGDGHEKIRYTKELANSKVKCVFHGFLSRQDVFDIYKKSHLFLLPSDSEGFPKVIAEAAAFGCIPIVSEVSSIGQYVNTRNGFLWSTKKVKFIKFFNDIHLEENNLKKKQEELYQLAYRFTFENYFNALQTILKIQ